MTQTEHLNAIVARCHELLTGGEASRAFDFRMPTGYIGRNTAPGEHYRAGYFAGTAEAGWRSTIAAINLILYCRPCDDSYIDDLANEIIAAWPIELTK
jgi:hypothetical protein